MDLAKLSLRCQGIGQLKKLDSRVGKNGNTYHSATFVFLGVEIRVSITPEQAGTLAIDEAYQVDGYMGEAFGNLAVNPTRITVAGDKVSTASAK